MKQCMLRISLAAVVTLGVGAAHAGVCDGLSVKGKHERARYAPLVATAIGGGVQASKVEVQRLLREQEWSAAFVRMPGHEDGVFFFQSLGGAPRFRQVWGGRPEPWESPFAMKWAENLGVPAGLAQCFATIVAGG